MAIEKIRVYNPLQEMSLRRFIRLLTLENLATPITPEVNKRLLDKARYSIYRDCINRGLEEEVMRIQEHYKRELKQK